MNERELIKASRSHLYNATVELDANNQAGYTEHMSTVRDLLLEELTNAPPANLSTILIAAARALRAKGVTP